MKVTGLVKMIHDSDVRKNFYIFSAVKDRQTNKETKTRNKVFRLTELKGSWPRS